MSDNRINAFIRMTREEISFLFSTYDSGLAVTDVESLNSMSNTNYVVTASGAKHLLKIYQNTTDVIEMAV